MVQTTFTDSTFDPAKYAKTLWLGSLVLIIITFILAYFKIRSAGEAPLVLHYNVIIGVDLFGSAKNLYILPATGLACGLVNYVVWKFSGKTKFMGALSAFISFVVSLILLLALLFLFRAN